MNLLRGKARAITLALVGVGLGLFAACTVEDGDEPPAKALSAVEREVCLSGGGRVGRGGVFPDELCFRPLPDAGKACTKASDCSGQCLTETMSCSKEAPMFGCYGFMDEQGRPADICVD